LLRKGSERGTSGIPAAIGMIAYAKTVEEIITVVVDEILEPIVFVLFGLATILFLWGAMEFIIYRENEEKRTSAKRHMFWGVAGFVIMITVNGILWILINFWNQVSGP